MFGLIDIYLYVVFGGLELVGVDMGNEQVGFDELEWCLCVWCDNGKV